MRTQVKNYSNSTLGASSAPSRMVKNRVAESKSTSTKNASEQPKIGTSGWNSRETPESDIGKSRLKLEV